MFKFPDFFIIGAARSGTTSLFYYLQQHPSIFFPEEKEPNFFCWDPEAVDALVRPGVGLGDRYATHWTKSFEEYRRYFKGMKYDQIAGEASVSYLYSPVTAERLFRQAPDAKLIAVLRHPVDRAWSHYLHMVRDGREMLSFSDALEAEENRIRKGWEFAWHYRNMGLYAVQLSRFYEFFPEDHIRVHLFEYLKQNPLGVTHATLDFLGLDTRRDIRIDSPHNVSGELKSKLLARIANKPSALRNAVKYIVPRRLGHTVMEIIRQANLKTEKPAMPADVRHQLNEFYAEDIMRTAQLIGRDLSHWLLRDN